MTHVQVWRPIWDTTPAKFFFVSLEIVGYSELGYNAMPLAVKQFFGPSWYTTSDIAKSLLIAKQTRAVKSLLQMWWWWWWLFPRMRGFWENVRQFISHLNFFFFKWRLARVHYFHSFDQDQSTVARRAETTVTECSLTVCVWAHFLIGSHTMPGQRHRQPTPTSLGQRRMRV